MVIYKSTVCANSILKSTIAGLDAANDKHRRFVAKYSSNSTAKNRQFTYSNDLGMLSQT